MAAWKQGNGTLRVESKDNPDTIRECNKENIAGITDFHTIKIEMLICTHTDMDEIFTPCLPYIVTYDGKIINGTQELNKIYFDFNNWSIIRSDDSPVSKKHIRREIEKVKIKDIEVKWSTKYEKADDCPRRERTGISVCISLRYE